MAPQTIEQLYQSAYHADLLGDFPRAKMLYGRVLAAQPDHPFAQLAVSELQMMESNFKSGREGYEARFLKKREGDNSADWRHIPVPRWRGENLSGKRLYLWTEQGVGDVLMFGGFLPYLLSQNPAHITLGAPDKMISLLARSFPAISVESIEHITDHFMAPLLKTRDLHKELETVPAESRQTLITAYERALLYQPYDYAAPIGDMMVFGMPGYVPKHHLISHVCADPELKRQMSALLPPPEQKRRIGISWHSGNPYEGSVRSIPLEQWGPILKVADCHFISLQHGISHEEIRAMCDQYGVNIETLPFEPVQDIERLAAIIACLDQVITIDNSNAHLAGALGVPTTLLLPKGHDFRWPLQEDGGTLWYKSVHTLRQNEALNWKPVVMRAAKSLQKIV